MAAKNEAGPARDAAGAKVVQAFMAWFSAAIGEARVYPRARRVRAKATCTAGSV